MSSPATRSLIIRLLLVAAIALLVGVFHSPAWWVSLTAPNYPKEAFPDGVRIHFHMSGVVNGCQKVVKAEIQDEEEALDCVHEMDTINHYVGMYPIASGAVIETAFAPFLFAFMAVLLLGFVFNERRNRLIAMAAGFALLAVWMSATWLGEEGIKHGDTRHLEFLAHSLDQDKEAEEKVLSPAEALIERLKASLAEDDEPEPEDDVAPDEEPSDKEAAFASLRASFEADQVRRPAGERQEWTGSGSQVLAWHYDKNLRRYFNNPEETAPMVDRTSAVANGLYWLLLLAMPVFLACAWNTGSRPYWLLVLLPMLLPVGFIVDFSAWLWWYGHTLNDMGAFTLKPFMPTVFGEGKVAQFTTHSYPHVGFAMMLVFVGLLIAAALLRRAELAEPSPASAESQGSDVQS